MLLIIMIFKILLITSIYLINNVNSYNLIPNVKTRRLNTRKEVTVYEPNWTDKTTPSVMLFTGADGIIPPEIYNEFLSQLSSEKISVHVGINDEDSIREELEYMENNYSNITLVGHSSGCMGAIKACLNNNNIKQLILMDPVDNRFFTEFLKTMVKNNLPFFKDERSIQLSTIDKGVIINAARAYEWNIYPLRVPFIPTFSLKPDDVDFSDTQVVYIEAKDYGHADIIDRRWSNIMHSTAIVGNDNRSLESLNVYKEWLSKIISSVVYPVDDINKEIKDYGVNYKIKSGWYN